MRRLIGRLLSIADLPGDDDDARLRKRAGVAAGYITIFAPLSMPLGVAVPIALPGALALSVYSLVNLAVLARSRRFERYFVALTAVGPVFVLFANTIGGGITTGGGGMTWAFLVPAYAILALGPRRATPWFYVFLATVLLGVVTAPLARQLFPAPPYVVQVLFFLPGLALPLTIVFLLLRYTDVRRREAEARSDALLTNAIPRAIADRLRHGEDRIADAYPETTVVFTDIASFTPWAGATDPARVVALLDDLFSRLDAVAATIGMEKIKTVGDAYMAVAGAPQPCADHAERGLAFGRAALAAADRWRLDHGLDLQIRVGIASGPAVGGVIGRQRLLFDLWGATVNTAARMESSGLAGRIQIAASTRDLLGSEVATEPRDVEVKGLGRLTTHIVAR